MRWLAISLSLLIAGACHTQVPAGHEPDTGIQQLVRLCIDTTLALDPGLNTSRYQVDFGRIKAWQASDIEQALQSRPVQQTNLDSLLHHDSTWLQYGYLEIPVIRIESLDTLSDGRLRLRAYKLKASDGAIEVELIIRRTGDHFECLSRKILRIS